MQEDLENKSVALTTKTVKITGKVLAKLMQAALRKMKQSRDAPKQGRMSLKQLAKGGALASIPITDGNIRDFEPVARKYNVNFELKHNAAANQWVVFFRAKDIDAITSAFKEFSSKALKHEVEKPSAHEAMQNHKDNIEHAVRDKTRHKRRGMEER